MMHAFSVSRRARRGACLLLAGALALCAGCGAPAQTPAASAQAAAAAPAATPVPQVAVPALADCGQDEANYASGQVWYAWDSTRSLLMRYDLTTLEAAPLCDVSGCAHADESCPAWYATGSYANVDPAGPHAFFLAETRVLAAPEGTYLFQNASYLLGEDGTRQLYATNIPDLKSQVEPLGRPVGDPIFYTEGGYFYAVPYCEDATRPDTMYCEIYYWDSDAAESVYLGVIPYNIPVACGVADGKLLISTYRELPDDPAQPDTQRTHRAMALHALDPATGAAQPLVTEDGWSALYYADGTLYLTDQAGGVYTRPLWETDAAPALLTQVQTQHDVSLWSILDVCAGGMVVEGQASDLHCHYAVDLATGKVRLLPSPQENDGGYPAPVSILSKTPDRLICPGSTADTAADGGNQALFLVDRAAYANGELVVLPFVETA